MFVVEHLLKAAEPSGLPSLLRALLSCIICLYISEPSFLCCYPEPFYLNWRLQESLLTERNNAGRVVTMPTGLLYKCTNTGVKNVTHS